MLKQFFKKTNNPDQLSAKEVALERAAEDQGKVEKEVPKGLVVGLRIALIIIGIVILANLALAFYWSREPVQFDVKEVALKRAGGDSNMLVPGYITTSTLIEVASTLLDKPGGYLSNDVTPPSVFLDNIPNWEWGVLIQVRDMARVLRNDLSRSQTQSAEDLDLSIADPQFHFDHGSWVLPSTEGEYNKAIGALERYLNRLGRRQAQFFTRADNLREWLFQVSKRLGNISNRLSASVPRAEARLLGLEEVPVGEETQPTPAQPSPQNQQHQTPWLEVDDVFFEARGTTWALLHFLSAIAIDYEPVLRKKNAGVSFMNVINILEATQQPIRSPMILRGRGFGMWANHSLVMGSYISRANATIIDLVNLLAQG